MKKFFQLFLLAITLVLISCSTKEKETADSRSNSESTDIYPRIEYDLLSHWDDKDNIDSPTFWQSADGKEAFVIATSKERHNLFVYDANNLKLVKQVGRQGKGEVEFDRPNGIWIDKDYLFVCERDNHRIQVLKLPEFSFIGFIGEKELKRPYGLTLYQTKDGHYQLFVTDQYESETEVYLPASSLNERVKEFSFNIIDGKINYNLVKSFGETTGKGVLWIVESIFADTTYNRLLIAEEDKNQNIVKVYDMNGKYIGVDLGDDLIEYQAEGIMMYDCGNGEGYYFLTDQDYYTLNNNTFHIFNRKDMKYIGSFISDKINNTDGIWMTNQKFGKFNNGALIAVNDDGGVGIIDINKIFTKLNIKCN